MHYANGVQRFFCEAKREANEPLPTEFIGEDGKTYALVSTGVPYVMQEPPDEWLPSFESLEASGHSDWMPAPSHGP